MEPKQGFTLSADPQQHIVTLRLWGRWDANLGQTYLTAIQQQVQALDCDEEGWDLLIDVADYIPPAPDVEQVIREGLAELNDVPIKKEAMLVRGAIPPLLSHTGWRPAPTIVSYFQSKEHALHWLLEES